MKVSRLILILASVALAGAQAFAAKTVSFAMPVPYDSGAAGANAVAAVDLNSDGFPDLVVATNNGVSVLLNNGDGTFSLNSTYATNGTLSEAVAVADVNNDGNLDIIVTNMCVDPVPTCYGISVLLGNGDGTFQSAVGHDSGGLNAGQLAVGDVNGDGNVDIVVVNDCQQHTCVGGTLTLLMGNGDGTFARFRQLSDGTGPVAMADMNGDGHPDLVTAAGIMLNNGDGTFQDPNGTVVPGAIAFAVGDLNGDGKMDVVATVARGLRVQLGNGDGTLQTAKSLSTGGANPLGVTVADFNGDSKLDIAVVNECTSLVNGNCAAPGKVGVLAGNGDGTFLAPVTSLSGGAFATGVAAADNDQDGKTDLIVTNACIFSGGITNCNADGVVATLKNNFLATVTIQLVSSENPAILGDPVTFTATLTSAPPVPDGSPVDFMDATTGIDLGTGLTSGGIASVTTSFSTKGGHSIRATYAGDLYHKSALKALAETVNPYPSATVVNSSPNPSTFGQKVTVTATVSSNAPGGPTGTVTFKSGSLALGSANLVGGVATVTTTKLPVGSDVITATYHGDTQSAASTGTTTQQVN